MRGLGATRAARVRFATIIVALALSVTACSVVGAGELTGGEGGNEPGWESPKDDGDDGTNETDAATDPDKDSNDSALPSVGTIEVKVERVGASPRLFTLEASECAVSVDRIRVVGVGSEDGTGIGAQINVDTTLREVLHAPTSTYLASGLITLTVADGSTWVSDGRPSTTPGVDQASMFDYRVYDDYAEFRTAWFGSGGDSAGFVHAWCS